MAIDADQAAVEGGILSAHQDPTTGYLTDVRRRAALGAEDVELDAWPDESLEGCPLVLDPGPPRLAVCAMLSGDEGVALEQITPLERRALVVALDRLAALDQDPGADQWAWDAVAALAARIRAARRG